MLHLHRLREAVQGHLSRVAATYGLRRSKTVIEGALRAGMGVGLVSLCVIRALPLIVVTIVLGCVVRDGVARWLLTGW